MNRLFSMQRSNMFQEFLPFALKILIYLKRWQSLNLIDMELIAFAFNIDFGSKSDEFVEFYQLDYL